MSTSRAIVVIDLAFGDCGKGAVVDSLTRQSAPHTIVRFNGGPQAGHNVVTPDGRHHTFSQFGSGSLASRSVRTLLSRFMLIEPYALLNEAAHLAELRAGNVLDRLLIDARCALIMPPQQAANRLRELGRGDRAHGTCGLGVGETMADSIAHPELILHAHEMADSSVVSRKLTALCDLKIAELRDELQNLGRHPKARRDVQTLLDRSWLDAAIATYAHVAREAKILNERAIAEVLAAPGVLLFEGAQGVLLDQWAGFHPHTTWSTTTAENAIALLDESGYREARACLGVLRTYFTRHGAGPLVSEDAELRDRLPESHNDSHGAQGQFRVGPFDLVAARYALEVAGGVDALAITHLDSVPLLPAKTCVAYRDDESALGADDADLVVRSNHRITRLLPPGEHDLDRQARLTRIVRRCLPEFQELPTLTPADFCDHLSGELRRPIAITAQGLAAGDIRAAPWLASTKAHASY